VKITGACPPSKSTDIPSPKLIAVPSKPIFPFLPLSCGSMVVEDDRAVVTGDEHDLQDFLFDTFDDL